MAENSVGTLSSSGGSMAMLRSPVARASCSSPTKRRMIQPDHTLEYCVKQNETLESVAAQFNTTPSELCRLNRLAVRMIFPGQLLFVPDESSSADTTRPPPAPRKSVDLVSPSSSSLLLNLNRPRRGSEIALPSNKNLLLLNEEFSSSGTTGSADSLSLHAVQQQHTPSSREENELEIGASASALHQHHHHHHDTLRKSPANVPGHVVREQQENEMLAAVNNAGGRNTPKKRSPDLSRQISADEMRRLDEECLAKFLKMQAKYVISSHGLHSQSRPSSRATSPPPPPPAKVPTSSVETTLENARIFGYEFVPDINLQAKPSIVSSTASSAESISASIGAVDGVLLITPNAIMFDPDVSDPLCIRNGVDKYGVITPLETIVSIAIYKSIGSATRRPRKKSSKMSVTSNGGENSSVKEASCDINVNTQELCSARRSRPFHYAADIGGGSGSAGDLEEIPEEADVISAGGTREHSEHDLLSVQRELGTAPAASGADQNSSRAHDTENEANRLAAAQVADKKRSPSPSSSAQTKVSSSRKSSGGSSSSSSSTTATSAISSKLNSSIFMPFKNAAKKSLSTTTSSSTNSEQQQQIHHSEKSISVTVERRKSPSPAAGLLLQQQQNPAEQHKPSTTTNRVQFSSDTDGNSSSQPTAKRTLFQKASSLTVLPITAMSKSVVGSASNFLTEVANTVTPGNAHQMMIGADEAAARQAADVRNASPKPGETFLQWRRRTTTTSSTGGGADADIITMGHDAVDQTIGDNETFIMVTSPPKDDATSTLINNKTRERGSQSPEDMRRSASADPRSEQISKSEDIADVCLTSGRARSSSDRSSPQTSEDKKDESDRKISVTTETGSSKHRKFSLASLRSSLKHSSSPTTTTMTKESSRRTTKKSSKQSIGDVMGTALLPLSDVKKQQIGFLPTITAADCPALFRSINELIPKKHGDDLSESGDCVYLLVKLHPHKRHQSSKKMQHVSLGPVQGFHHKKLKSEYWFRIARHYSHSVYSFFMHWRPEMSDGSESTGDEQGFILFDVHYGEHFAKESASSHAPLETTTDIDEEDSDDISTASSHTGSSYSTPASASTSSPRSTSPAASDDETAAAAAGDAAHKLHAIHDAETVLTGAGDAATSSKPTHHHHHHHHRKRRSNKKSFDTSDNKKQPVSASPSASSTASSYVAHRMKQQKDAAQRARRVSEQRLHQFELADEQAGRQKKRALDLSLSCEWEVVALDEAMRRATVIDSLDHQQRAMDQAASSSKVAAENSSSCSINEAGAASLADFLPELIDAESSLFQEQPELLRKLSNPVVLPARAQGYPWRMIYNTAIHGFSLKSLYRNMQPVNELYTTAPFCVLIVCDTENHIFGAMLSQPFKLSDQFYGTGESFVFTFSPKFRHFMWTGDNSLFAKGTREALFIGASDGNFAIWLDGDLYHGRSQRCATFDNDALVPGSGDFVVKAVEAWAIY